MGRLSSLILLWLTAGCLLASGGFARADADWRVQAGKRFQKAGAYTIRGSNTRFRNAIAAWGKPSSCKADASNHAVASWKSLGIWVDLWTYGGMPPDENGCISPDLIWISEIRLSDQRWMTAFGLHVGDSTVKLRRLYPHAGYHYPAPHRRSEYWLVTRHGPCIGVCTAYEQAHGVDSPRLSAQVRNGRVVAFWLSVFAQGE